MMSAEGVDATLDVGAGAVLAGYVGEGDDAGDSFTGDGVAFFVFAFGGDFSSDVRGVAVRGDVRLTEVGGEVE